MRGRHIEGLCVHLVHQERYRDGELLQVDL